ncbi:MAG: glycosyltransferase [Coriobacteriia bacterium]|nr:glycosyltransferase [Coriobacteriia bacterium]
MDQQPRSTAALAASEPVRRTGVCVRVNNAYTHDLRVRREAETLAAGGYDVVVVADAGAGLPSEETAGGVRVRRVGRTSRIPFASLVRPLAEEGADVYHAHDVDSLLPCFLAARRAGAKLVYDSHELWSGHARDKVHAKRRALVALEGPLLRRADALLTASPAYTEEIVRRYGYEGPAETLLNAPRHFPDEELAAAWAERDASEEVRIRYVGVFQHGRGAVPLIASLAHLPVDHVVELIGPIPQPDYETAIREAAAPFGDRVRFLGVIPPEEIVPALAAAHVSAVTIEPHSLSYRLTAPNKLFDSFMAGTPVVASEMPTISRFVRETGAGVLADVTDPADIARAVLAVLARAAGYARAARAAALRYNWETEREKLLGLYERLTGA